MDPEEFKRIEFKLREISDSLDQLILIGEDVFDMDNGLDRLI